MRPVQKRPMVQAAPQAPGVPGNGRLDPVQAGDMSLGPVRTAQARNAGGTPAPQAAPQALPAAPPPALPQVTKGAKGSQGTGRSGNGKLPVGSGNGKLPGAYAGAGGGSGSVGNPSGPSTGGPTPPPPGGPPAPYDVNAGRVNLLEQILSAPESMTPEVQANILQQVRDSRDLALQDEQRQIRESHGARGLGGSGVQDRLLFDAQMRRSSDLGNAERTIKSDAARTNFNDRMNAVQAALTQQLGMGGLGLQHAQLENQTFNQDRQFQLQLAQQVFDTMLGGQQQQSNLLGQFNALISGGMNWQDAIRNVIMQQANARYADPNVGSVQQTGYAPNPYLDYLSSQNASSGGGGGTDWFSAAMQGGSALAGLFV